MIFFYAVLGCVHLLLPSPRWEYLTPGPDSFVATERGKACNVCCVSKTSLLSDSALHSVKNDPTPAPCADVTLTFIRPPSRRRASHSNTYRSDARPLPPNKGQGDGNICLFAAPSVASIRKTISKHNVFPYHHDVVFTLVAVRQDHTSHGTQNIIKTTVFYCAQNMPAHVTEVVCLLWIPEARCCAHASRYPVLRTSRLIILQFAPTTVVPLAPPCSPRPFLYFPPIISRNQQKLKICKPTYSIINNLSSPRDTSLLLLHILPLPSLLFHPPPSRL